MALDALFSPALPAACAFLILQPSRNIMLSTIPRQSHHRTPLPMLRKSASAVLMACRYVSIVVRIMSPGLTLSDIYSMGIVPQGGELP